MGLVLPIDQRWIFGGVEDPGPRSAVAGCGSTRSNRGSGHPARHVTGGQDPVRGTCTRDDRRRRSGQGCLRAYRPGRWTPSRGPDRDANAPRQGQSAVDRACAWAPGHGSGMHVPMQEPNCIPARRSRGESTRKRVPPRGSCARVGSRFERGQRMRRRGHSRGEKARGHATRGSYRTGDAQRACGARVVSHGRCPTGIQCAGRIAREMPNGHPVRGSYGIREGPRACSL
jgi:hypothetical protein